MILHFKNSANEISSPSDDHIEGAIIALPLRHKKGFLGQSIVICQDDDNWLGINSTHIQGSYHVVDSVNGKQFQTNELVPLKEAILIAQKFTKGLDYKDGFEWKPYDINEQLRQFF